MAKNETVPVDENAGFVELTDDDCTKVTLKNMGGDPIGLFGSTSSADPSGVADGDQWIVLDPGQAIVGALLTDLFPGISGIVRLFARATKPDASIFISHD